jgi:hypothetical protein
VRAARSRFATPAQIFSIRSSKRQTPRLPNRKMTLALDIPMPSRCAVRPISAAVSPDEQPDSLSAQRGSPRVNCRQHARDGLSNTRLHSAAASGLLTLSNDSRSAAAPKRAATNAADGIEQCDGERAHLEREGSRIDEQGNASGSGERARAVPVQIIAVAAVSQFCNFSGVDGLANEAL